MEYKQRYCVGIDKLKFFLIPFVCVNALGFPGSYGGFVQILAGFAAPCFFVLCGFLVMSRDGARRKGKLLRAAKRAGMTFLLMLGIYFATNLIYCSLQGSSWLAMIADGKNLIYFLALNEWPLPVGDAIWFIHALFYAYVFLLLINGWLDNVFVRRGLLVACVIIMLATGEFAGLLGMQAGTIGAQEAEGTAGLGTHARDAFRLLLMGRDYLPGSMMTRALPYLLIGGLLRERADDFFRVPPFVYPILSVMCLVASFTEFWFLSENGLLVDRSHNVFMGLAAIALACWAVASPEASLDYVAYHGRGYSKWIYVTFQLVDAAFIVFVSRCLPKGARDFMEFEGVAVFGICLFGAAALNAIKKAVRARKADATGEAEADDGMDEMEGLGETEEAEVLEGLEKTEGLKGTEKIGNVNEVNSGEEGWQMEMLS